jgi:DNA-binding NtrC family response regulator
MKIRVLLVDDEKNFIDALSQRLEMRDFAVATACNGDEALRLIDEYEYDVIVLDVRMPGEDGIQMLKLLKELKPLIEIIMLTGNATVQIAIEGMKLGAYDFLVKPADTDLLVGKINSAYKLKSDHEERIRQAEIENIVKHKGW